MAFESFRKILLINGNVARESEIYYEVIVISNLSIDYYFYHSIIN